MLNWYSNKSVLQRMSFLLEEMSVDKSLPKLLMEFLDKTPFFPVLLSPTKGKKPGSTGNRWKIDVNLKIESDL
tara:strand:+ start:1122 stop:1340 length:219 start_codon:yes stop_codon:yes gene_type:complete